MGGRKRGNAGRQRKRGLSVGVGRELWMWLEERKREWKGGLD